MLDVLALVCGFSFCYLVKDFNFLNKFGKNSLYIYLWHGVIYMFLKNIGEVSINTNKYMIVAFVLIFVSITYILLGTNFVKKVTDYMFSKVNRLLRLEV